MAIMTNELHPKIIHNIEMMLLNAKINLPYYGEFLLHVNFYSRPNDPTLKTAGVNVTSKGMNYYFNPEFIDSLTQEQVNFLNLHELCHLLFNHVRRTRMGGYDHKLSNIAQDMIINQILIQDIKGDFIDIPKDNFGRNTALFIPKEYEGEWVYEILYDYIKQRKEDFDKRRDKKEDNKIFSELFCKKARPTIIEVTTNFKGQESIFVDILEEKSKAEYEKYIDNFTRKVLVSLQSGLPVKLIGHTSSIVPDGENNTFNNDLSVRRAQIFKNSIIENIDDYMDKYSHCLAIIEDESKLSDAEKLDFIFKYEELSNKTIQKQREVELQKVEEGQQGSKIDMLFKEYRFTELNKMDITSLKNIITAKKLTPPDVANMQATYLGLAQNLLTVEGKGNTEPIIINDDDDKASILRTEIAGLSQYATYKRITDPEQKQLINRRIEFKFDESQDDNMGGGSSDSENQGNRSGYGKNGVNDQECFGMEDILEDMDNNDGQFLDSHMNDEIPEELREQMVKDIHEKLKARGLVTGDIEKTIEKLQKRKKDYLKEIKRGISFIKGNVRVKSISRPNRKGIQGLKGNKKMGFKINCILDTSGSMGGYFDKALSFIFRNDIEINLIMCDTTVKSVESIKSMSDFKKVRIKGLGGTTIQPAFDLVSENFNQYNTLLLTDGYTDNLDLSAIKGKVLIISNGHECPIAVSNGKVKQIIIKE